MDINEYIEKWVEQSITLSEWLSQENIDHWEFIELWSLNESEIEEIEHHQHCLFNKAVENSVNNKIENYQEAVKKEVFTEQLRLLELFLKSTKVDTFLIELLKPIVIIRDSDYLNILKEYQNIIARRYDDFKKTFSINKQGSFSDGDYFKAKIIWEYKSEIEKYLIKLPPQQTVTEKLTVKQIALIHFYEGIPITRGNSSEIAAKYGYKAKNSGEGLFQDFTAYSSTANRKGRPTLFTHKKLKNKIELFESVINHLSENKKQRAIDEINVLKTFLENEY